jgi:hypothetical protein
MEEQSIKVLVEDLFSDELADLHKESDAIESLFGEVKTQWDALMRNNGRGMPLQYLAQQTENLVQLRKSKADLIKQRLGIKKLAVDIDVKRRGLDYKLGAGSAAAGLLDVFKQMVAAGANPRAVLVAVVDQNQSNNDSDEALMARLAEMGVQSPVIDAEFSEVKDAEEENELMVVCDIRGKPYIVDKNYEIKPSDDYDFSEWSATVWQDEEGDWHATDHDGDEVEVIDVAAPEQEEDDDE